MKKIFSNLIRFIIGFSVYLAIEIIWDGSTHISMGVLGGLSFLIGGLLNDKFSWKIDLLLQSSLITVLITILEAIVGNIDYYFWHLEIWDYSNMPMNYFNGKICVPFCLIWLLFSFVIIFLHDAITYYWMHIGEQPEYWFLGKCIWRMPERKCTITQ